jgi:hypothetical protein
MLAGLVSSIALRRVIISGRLPVGVGMHGLPVLEQEGKATSGDSWLVLENLF